MKSLVYSLDGEVNNESMFNPTGYSMRFYTQKNYNEVINEIYNDDKVNSDKELLEYLITRKTPEHIMTVYKLLSIDFVRNDQDVFNTLKQCNYKQHVAALKLVEEKFNKDIEVLKRLFLLLPYMKGDCLKFCNYFCNNTNFDYEVQEVLLKLSMKYWSTEMQFLVDGILKSEKILDKKQALMYICEINDVKSADSIKKLKKFGFVLEEGNVLNDKEEMQRLVLVANSEDSYTFECYCKMYFNPKICNNKEIKNRLFEVLNKEKEDNGYHIYLGFLNSLNLLGEEIINNTTLLERLLNSNDFNMSYILTNVFSCKELVSNEQMMSLILKMPNSWCLEQLLLAYETKKIKHDIEILTNIASLAPFSDKMEDARLSYGVNEFELEWIDRKIKYAREKKEYIEADERSKIRRLSRK